MKLDAAFLLDDNAHGAADHFLPSRWRRWRRRLIRRGGCLWRSHLYGTVSGDVGAGQRLWL